MLTGPPPKFHETRDILRRAKAMMAVQSLVAVSTLALVVARAINVLK
jgi:hypothetical protein